MGQTTTYFCDRCRTETQYKTALYDLTISVRQTEGLSGYNVKKRIEVCSTCFDSIVCSVQLAYEPTKPETI